MEEPSAKRLKIFNETKIDVAPKYGEMLEEVSKCLRKDDVEALATIAELPPSEKEQVTSIKGNGSRHLFNLLERRGVIGRYDVRWLQKNLRDINNEMGGRIIDGFISERVEECELPSEPDFSESENEDDETTFENFLEKVGLKDKHPGKLKLKTFLQLGTNEKDFAQIFWQKLTSLNYRAGILQELVSKDYSMRDFIFCLLHCCDDFLRQDILEKMSACQLAVPVLLQGVSNGKPIFILWSLRRVMKKWRGESDTFAIEQPIISYPVLNICFLRVGNVRLSKSQLMNTMLSDIQGYSAHRFFLNREKDFAVPRFSPGSVECVWFLPMRENEHQIFNEVIAFFNLRGDCTKYPKQTAFVCKAAHLTVALVTTSKRKDYIQYINQIKNNSKSTLFISISEEESRTAASKKVHRPKYKDGWLFVNVVQMDILSKTICEEIVKNCKVERTSKTRLESLTEICGEEILIDERNERCTNARLAVCNIFGGKESVNKLDVLDFKQNSFPLQIIWKDWVEIDKATFQVETDVHNSLEHQMQNKVLEKRKKRKLQLQKDLSPAMQYYLQTMKGAKSNSALLQYVITFMQEEIYHMVNENTREDMNDIAELERAIRQMRDQNLVGPSGNGYDSKSEGRGETQDRNQSEYKSKLSECNKLYKNCRAKNLGGEHFLRELGQMYEAHMDLQGESISEPEEANTSNVTLLPSLAARLVTEMQSLEIMDGDTGCVPLTWVTSVLDTLTRELNDPKVLVLSVIGVQSSGKSTLLNCMFGVRFPVRAGRCTRGLFIQLLELEQSLSEELGFQYLVVVDSEGIRSIDHDDRRFDNELVTLALSIANVTIFNIEGENIGPDMTGILQIAAHALMRMKEVDLECHCRIVQQRVSDMTAADRNKANTKKIKETLDEATKFAAEEEGLEGRYQQFSDVVDLHVDEDLQYVPCLWAGGMAPPNHLYSETVSKIKSKLFRDIKKGSIYTDLTLSSFTERVRDVWKAIKEEDFVFNFHDSVKAVDYNKLCLNYSQWIGQMRQDVQVKIGEVLSSITADSKNGSLEPDVARLKGVLETEIDKQDNKLKKCVKEYIAKHPRKNAMLRHKQEFLHDVDVVLNETKAHSLAKITDEYEIKTITLNLPHFQNNAFLILTRGASDEARKRGQSFPALDHFDSLWQSLLDKLKRENNITRVTVTSSFLQNTCLKLLLKVTRDMAVGSEVQNLLSHEGGITKHLSLTDSSKYITVKFVKSWLRQEIASQAKKNETSSEEKGQFSNEGDDFTVPRSAITNRKGERKCKQTLREADEQQMEEKRQQAISFLRKTVEGNLTDMGMHSKAFDANLFQLMLQKTLKVLSTKDDTLNIKLPHRLIAKGLLWFCGRSVTECFMSGDSEIESYLDFGRFEISKCYFSFSNPIEQQIAAFNFIWYYLRKSLLEKIRAYGENCYRNVDYGHYTEPVQIPWDMLSFWYSYNCEFGTDYDLFESTLPDIVDIYVTFKRDECTDLISDDIQNKTLYYSNEIKKMHSRAKSWNEFCKLLGHFLSCPFIPLAGDIFQVTDFSSFSRMLDVKLRIGFDCFENYGGFDPTAFKNAAGLSFVCDQVCPMCGAWCDNLLESHTVHSSSLHRPRGFNGETYPDIDPVSNELSSESDSESEPDSQPSLSSNFYVEQYVLEDCFTSITSETATFKYNGKEYLCKKFKEVFPKWDIQPGKGNAANRLFWQKFFAEYYADEATNIPDTWYEIADTDVIRSLQQAKEVQINGRKPTSSMPLKKRLLASCSKS